MYGDVIASQIRQQLFSRSASFADSVSTNTGLVLCGGVASECPASDRLQRAVLTGV
jgi:hypothetical protein